MLTATPMNRQHDLARVVVDIDDMSAINVRSSCLGRIVTFGACHAADRLSAKFVKALGSTSRAGSDSRIDRGPPKVMPVATPS